LVEQRFLEKNVPEFVATAIEADEGLSESLRQAALRALLRRLAP
jgi:hypothetical protein